MVANAGHLPLLYNWACSLKKYGIPIPKHIVFTTDPEVAQHIRDIGLVAFTVSAVVCFQASNASMLPCV
jgi:hypothetical protein